MVKHGRRKVGPNASDDMQPDEMTKEHIQRERVLLVDMIVYEVSHTLLAILELYREAVFNMHGISSSAPL